MLKLHQRPDGSDSTSLASWVCCRCAPQNRIRWNQNKMKPPNTCQLLGCFFGASCLPISPFTTSIAEPYFNRQITRQKLADPNSKELLSLTAKLSVWQVAALACPEIGIAHGIANTGIHQIRLQEPARTNCWFEAFSFHEQWEHDW